MSTQKHKGINVYQLQSLRDLKQILCDSFVMEDFTCVCASVMQYLVDLKSPNLASLRPKGPNADAALSHYLLS
jgi:hypothetical protein